MDKCVLECNIRKACQAVNIWTRRLQCDMLLNDTDNPLQDGNNTQPCVFVKKADFDPVYNKSLKNCQACNGTTACDIGSGQCEIRECRQLVVPNATIKGNVLSVGSKIRINCNEQFAQRPNETLSICQKNGTWSNEPTCHYLFACAEPPTIENATVDPGTRSVSDIRNYKCNEGCIAQHADTNAGLADTKHMSIQCQENGTWTTADFKCIADCGDPIDVAYANVSLGGTLEGSTREYQCDEGYGVRNSDDTTVTCQTSGNWTSVNFSCSLTCAEPPTIVNATVDPGTRLVGDVRNYKCNEGCIAQHADTNAGLADTIHMSIQCQENGTWTTADFKCIADCGVPVDVANANVSLGGTLEGSTRTYQCDEAYIGSSDDTTVSCKASGNWSTVQFACIAKEVCATGWYQIGDSCYFAEASLICNVYEAKDYCNASGSYLVALETEAECTAVRAYIKTQFGSMQWWIGLTDEDEEGTWRWMSTGEVATFTRWSQSNEPGGGDWENYVVMWASDYWADVHSDNRYYPICEKSTEVIP